jgi:hypothetical protein
MTIDELEKCTPNTRVRITNTLHEGGSGQVGSITSVKPRGAFVRYTNTWGNSREEFFLAGELEMA